MQLKRLATKRLKRNNESFSKSFCWNPVNRLLIGFFYESNVLVQKVHKLGIKNEIPNTYKDRRLLIDDCVSTDTGSTYRPPLLRTRIKDFTGEAFKVYAKHGRIIYEK